MKILYEMPTAYVLINCDLGSEEEIIKELKKLTEVIEVSGVYGVYDIILKIKSETMDRLRETITWHVRRIDKVRSTLTMIVIEGQGEKGKRQAARSLTSNTLHQIRYIYTNINPPTNILSQQEECLLDTIATACSSVSKICGAVLLAALPYPLFQQILSSYFWFCN